MIQASRASGEHEAGVGDRDGRSAPGRPRGDRNGRHSAAVATTLHWADEAAGREEYEAALGWVSVVEVIGDPLPDEYQARKAAWELALTRRVQTVEPPR